MSFQNFSRGKKGEMEGKGRGKGELFLNAGERAGVRGRFWNPKGKGEGEGDKNGDLETLRASTLRKTTQNFSVV